VNAPQQPQFALARDGSLHLVYGAGDDVFHTRSTDGGQTFATPERAFRCPNMSLGMRRGPRIAVSGETIVVSAIGGTQGKGRDGDLQAWRRDGDGRWLGPSRINDVADSAREGLHAMAASPDGMLWCVWLDLRNRKTEIYAVRSANEGATWEPNVLVYQSPDGSVCECCHPSLAIDAQGGIHVMFRNSLSGNRDMYLCSSTDGRTFSPARKLGSGAWELKACPMDGGMLAVDSHGSVSTVWRRKSELYLTGETQKELHLGGGEQPWISATRSGPRVVWTAKRDGDLMLWDARNSESMRIASPARDPVIVSPPDQQRSIIAWEARTETHRAILVSIVDP
jgi:hypothetical protein